MITHYETKLKLRIFSFHWLTCDSFLIWQNGILILFFCKDNTPIPISTFILPVSKERWTTCGIIVDNNIIVGDRKGRIHLFEIGNPCAIQTLKKVHSFLGVTNLIKVTEGIISLGRDGMVKTFLLTKANLVTVTSHKVPFTWLLNIIDNLLLAFTSNNFIIWDRKFKRVLIEKSCGGGHRSWDFHMKESDALFTYIKDKAINITRIDFQGLIPRDLITGFHVDQVNCIEIFEFNKRCFLVSGGEDTTLRITADRRAHV